LELVFLGSNMQRGFAEVILSVNIESAGRQEEMKNLNITALCRPMKGGITLRKMLDPLQAFDNC